MNAHKYMKEKKGPNAKVFSWTLWKYDMDPSKVVPAADGSIKVQVRAVGNNGEIQESRLEDMYNVRGLMNNAPD